MRARLQELGAIDEVMVVQEPDRPSQGKPPAGLSASDVFHVSFRLSSALPDSAANEMGAIAFSLLAYQPAAESQDSHPSNCLGYGPRPSWVLHTGPFAFMIQRGQKDVLLSQARELILTIIDRVLVLNAIIRSNETAHASFNEIVYGRQ